MNKVIHIYRKGQKICDIARLYNTTPIEIFNTNLISNIDYLEDFTPLLINIKSNCDIDKEIYCRQEKRRMSWLLLFQIVPYTLIV